MTDAARHAAMEAQLERNRKAAIAYQNRLLDEDTAALLAAAEPILAEPPEAA